MSNSEHVCKKQKMSAEATPKDIFSQNTHDFLEVVKKITYVDHSLLIKIFFKEKRRLFVLAPKMFCKSTNLNMVKEFYAVKEDGDVEDNIRDRHRYEVFKNLKIMKEDKEELKKHFCAHPVIHVDFKTPGPIESLQDAREHCYECIYKAFIDHQPYLEKNLLHQGYKARCEKWWNSTCSADVMVAAGLEFLCRCLYTAHKGKRVVILVDECDAVVTSALSSECKLNILRKICSFMTKVYGGITKGEIKDMVQGVLLTGVSYISGIGYSTDVKTINCRFLDDTEDNSDEKFPRDSVVPFYGLHEDDCDELFSKLQNELKLTPENMKSRTDEIESLCNGYYTKLQKKRIYPLYKVLEFIIGGKINNDHATNIPHIVQMYMEATGHPAFAPTIIHLLGNGSVNIDNSLTTVNLISLINLRDSPSFGNLNIYLLLLLEAGTLTLANSDAADEVAVKIPNQLTAYHFQKWLKLTYQECYGQFNYNDMRECKKDMNRLKNFFLANNMEMFSCVLGDLHQHLTSLFEGFKNIPQSAEIRVTENSLQGLLYMTLCSEEGELLSVATEVPITDKHGKRGKIDMWMIDVKLNFAILVEFKINILLVDTKRDRKKTSIYALKEIRGEGEIKKVRYLDELEKRQIKDYFLIGISMDSLCRPSFSIATSRDQTEDNKKFFCVSETEPEEFPELCEFGVDLLKRLKEHKP